MESKSIQQPDLPIELCGFIVSLGGNALQVTGRSVCRAWRDFLRLQPRAGYGKACLAAAQGGHIKLFRWLIEIGGCHPNRDVLNAAIKGKYIAIVKYLILSERFSQYSIIKKSAKYGFVEGLEALEFYYQVKAWPYTAANTLTMRMALVHNHLNVVQWCHKHGVSLFGYRRDALAYGHYKLYHWIATRDGGDCLSDFDVNGGYDPEDLIKFEDMNESSHYCDQAARTGNLRLIESSTNGGIISYDLTAACITAAKHGHLAIVRYYFEIRGLFTESIITASLQSGNIDLIAYVFSHYYHNDPFIRPSAIEKAAILGGIPVLEYIFTQIEPSLINGRIRYALKNAKLEEAKWLVDHGWEVTDKLPRYLPCTVATLEFLRSLGMFLESRTDRFLISDPTALTWAREYGLNYSYVSDSHDLALIKNLYKEKKLDNAVDLLRAAVKRGNLPVVQYLRAIIDKIEHDTLSHIAIQEDNIHIFMYLWNDGLEGRSIDTTLLRLMSRKNGNKKFITFLEDVS